ncbi:MAG: EamA family transporter [Lachnospira pectinoschiza]
MKNLKGTFILLLAAFIWGTAFVAQTSAGDNIGAFTFNACRNIIGALFLFIVIAILDMRKYSDRYDNPSENNYNIYKKNYIINKKDYLTNANKWPVKEGVICGILLCIAMNLQQIGINTYPDGVAVSGRAGFLTATYVVMIAIVSVFMGQKFHKLTIIAAFVCIAECIFCVLRVELTKYMLRIY